MLNTILCFVWSFLVSVFAIPSIINVAHIKQLLDEPNMRTMHISLTPRLGGIAIFAGLVSALTIFGHFNKEIQQIIAGCIVLFFIGLKDDLVSVSVFKKFFVQVLAAGIVIFIGNIRITHFQGIFGLDQIPEGISYAFTFLVIIGITNAINLLDGLDGLAGTVTVFVATIFGLYFFNFGSFEGRAYADICFCLVGGVLGFLRYNFNKAIIFMGDTGSLVCGFLIAVLAVKFTELRPLQSAPVMSIALLIIPVSDTVRVFLMRILRGKSPFSPDKTHIHHILKSKNLSSLAVVSIILSYNIMAFVIAFLLDFMPVSESVFVFIAIAIFVGFILEYLNGTFSAKIIIDET